MSKLSRLYAVLLVAGGGFLGASTRYAVDLLFGSTLMSTLFTNVLGSFALGLLLYESLNIGHTPEYVRLAAATGFLSSFTTFSTFITDLVVVSPLSALGYLIASYVLGFTAVIVSKTIIDQLLVQT
ncbi:CrcB family protein [Salinarchaeum sp. IM2453]|uniref:fluoride efflux transporter FluC n=1 Tax=Salinarchaeum sp. IM2453 TaxID=2862870 RepID=UPI001C834EC9|nr:CrcB family protein [Salinarchaeum sp. IM2453]QZA89661.1 CrcB family protein [Salinarchaeum sp. IM2453]